jgi:acyl carrier protein
MNKGEIVAKLQSIFDDVFVEPAVLTEELALVDIAEYDSLTHISLMMSIEKHFGIHFNVGELDSIEKIGELADLILKRTEQSSRPV